MKLMMSVRRSVVFLLLGASAALMGQSTQSVRPGATSQSSQYQPQSEPALEKPLSQYAQELDSASAALGKVPPDPLFQTDPLGPFTRATDASVSWLEGSARLRFGATYTFLNQYATVIPDTARRHDQLSGRLDFSGNWDVYDTESTGGSIGLLVRSGTNIGMSQQFNLSDQMGSGIYLNSMQGGGRSVRSP